MKMCDCKCTEFNIEIVDGVIAIKCIQCNTVYFHNARYSFQEREITELQDAED